MKEYPKISNVFKFDEKYRSIVGMTETYEALKGLEWVGTEKVDGTNIRIYWDGHNVEIAGRTDRAEIPKHLLAYLEKTFKTQEMEYVLEQMFNDKEVYLFGEGYGSKIQAGGGLYSLEPKFILFDVNVNGYDLTRDSVNDIANRLGLDSVPVVFRGTLDEAIEFVKEHHNSTIGNGLHEMEGLVLAPSVMLYDSNHKQIKCKCKYRDVVKMEGNLWKKTA